MIVNSIDEVWHTPPSASNSPGVEGWMAKDDNFLYIYTDGTWKREPVASWIP